MVDPRETAAILARALAYPYATPERSYLYLDGGTRELPATGADFSARTPLLSAHVSPYGAVPATLHERPATTVPVFVIHPTAAQRALLTASEPNYDLVELPACLVVRDEPATQRLEVYLSKHGPLLVDGAPVALAAIRASGRTLPELDEPAMLEHVRAQVAPGLTLEDFVRGWVERGGMKLAGAMNFL